MKSALDGTAGEAQRQVELLLLEAGTAQAPCPAFPLPGQERTPRSLHSLSPYMLPKATSHLRGNPVPQACTPSSEAEARRPLWAH